MLEKWTRFVLKFLSAACLVRKWDKELFVPVQAIFPTVAVSACSNCNPTQKQWFRIVGRHLLANRPADIKKLRETFDPSEEHKEEFLKFITSDD